MRSGVRHDALSDAPLPKGVLDFLPEYAEKMAYIEEKIQRVFELWGFRRVITPLLEFLDVLAIGLGDDLRERAFRFDDRHSGRLLAVPPDITPQVARIVATRMQRAPLPHRLYYSGRVLRHADLLAGQSREIFQAGVELIGLDSPEADAEMIAMAVEVFRSLGITGFKIDIGQVDFLRGILDEVPSEGPGRARLLEAIGKKDMSALGSLLADLPCADSLKEQISALPRLYGGREVLDRASAVARSDRSRKALDTIDQVLAILDLYGVGEHLTIDLGEIRGFAYHTGITFEGFVPGHGGAVCGGGRYDCLMARYGCPAPATGFAFNILPLLAALESRPDVVASTGRDFLIFNRKDDRREALGLARALRGQGCTVARDIIRRGLDESLAYARQAGIRYMIVIGDERCQDDEVMLVRVADRTERLMSQAALQDVRTMVELQNP
jgi:ATP phosphoribosyltransferase regulatory subunit